MVIEPNKGVSEPSVKKKMKKTMSSNETNNISEESKEKNDLEEENLLPLFSFKYINIMTHMVCCILYIIPLVQGHFQVNHNTLYDKEDMKGFEPILDELHLDLNGDVTGSAPLINLFRNDYWGRSMYANSSHKSWRPISILLFRFIRMDNNFFPSIVYDRIVSLVLHGALAEFIANCACLLFPSSKSNYHLMLRVVTKLLFAFHPTHVESVSNAANRPHILALMFSILSVDYRIPFIFVPISVSLALTSCETATFQLPAILVTMTVIKWRNRPPNTENSIMSLIKTSLSLIPRYLSVIAVGLIYLFLRHYFDTLSIPDALIRPAENPFYDFVGMKRTLSYSLVLAVHIGKLILLDPIGFSHEYGYNCFPAVEINYQSDSQTIMETMYDILSQDSRVLFPISFLLLFLTIGILCLKKGLDTSLLFLVGFSWIFTLFPISGVVKVGTFIADRILLPSTVTFAIFGAVLFTNWCLQSWNPKRKLSSQLYVKYFIFFILLLHMGSKVTNRGSEWMTSFHLLESSLKICPNSAKSNLEMSKVHSGMYPALLDLEKSLFHVKKAAKIDPNYCDVHQQFAAIYFRQGDISPFEKHLTKAVICPFTMTASQHNFQRYWSIVTQNPVSGPKATERMNIELEIIRKAVREAIDRGEKMD